MNGSRGSGQWRCASVPSPSPTRSSSYAWRRQGSSGEQPRSTRSRLARADPRPFHPRGHGLRSAHDRRRPRRPARRRAGGRRDPPPRLRSHRVRGYSGLSLRLRVALPLRLGSRRAEQGLPCPTPAKPGGCAAHYEPGGRESALRPPGGGAVELPGVVFRAGRALPQPYAPGRGVPRARRPRRPLPGAAVPRAQEARRERHQGVCPTPRLRSRSRTGQDHLRSAGRPSAPPLPGPQGPHRPRRALAAAPRPLPRARRLASARSAGCPRRFLRVPPGALADVPPFHGTGGRGGRDPGARRPALPGAGEGRVRRQAARRARPHLRVRADPDVGPRTVPGQPGVAPARPAHRPLGADRPRPCVLQEKRPRRRLPRGIAIEDVVVPFVHVRGRS